MAVKATKSDRLNFRVSAVVKATLERAAETRHTGLSDFVLAAALREAERILADRTRFVLSEAQWSEFEAALDRPAEVSPELGQFLAKPSVLESQ